MTSSKAWVTCQVFGITLVFVTSCVEAWPSTNEVVLHYSNRPVLEEGRWHVTFQGQGEGPPVVVSKFLLGQVSFSMDELEQEWPSWGADERLEFSQSVRWAGRDLLVPALRFLIAHGADDVWHDVALTIAEELPKEESSVFLRSRCEECPLGRGSNYLQALAYTEHASSLAVLSNRLVRLERKMTEVDTSETEKGALSYEAENCRSYLRKLRQMGGR